MCELIDGNCFHIQTLKLFYSPQLITEKINPQRFLSTHSLLDYKIYELPTKIHLTKMATLLKLPPNNIQLLLEITFSRQYFLIKAKNISQNSSVPVFQKQMRKIFIKQFSKKNFLQATEPFKVIFSLSSHDWYMKSPYHYFETNQKKQFQNEFNKALQNLVNSLNVTLQSIDKITRNQKQQELKVRKHKQHEIIRYYVRCAIEPSISIKSQCEQYQSVINKYAASRSGLQDLIKFNQQTVEMNRTYFQGLWVYGFDIDEDSKRGFLDQISLTEKGKIQEETSIPFYIKSKQDQNKFVFNYCYFLGTYYEQRKIALGGNSQVFVIKPEIYELNSNYAENDDLFQKSQNFSRYISRHLVYKKNIDKSTLPTNKNYSIEHREVQIVSKMKGGSCLFLPKYYLNIQKNSTFGRKLFMDYLPGDTLHQYLQSHFQTISIHTKLYLILQILQTLRFISNHGIVHLDVKENNIIVLKNLICKVFDFGESYHYNVCGRNHQPKYTLLYASPQVVTSTNGRVFNQKSDVFSGGIMMYNLFFSRYPYFFWQQDKFQKSNFEGKLREKTFSVPEQIYGLGDNFLIQVINQLVLKCIQMQQQRRPYLDWLAIIVKKCLLYITSQ